MSRDSWWHTLKVALLLCVVCSVAVSTAAVALRSLQEANKRLEKQRNILLAAGLLEDPSADDGAIRDAFAAVETRLVNLEQCEIVSPSQVGVSQPSEYDPRAAVKDPASSVAIPPEEDLAGIKRREKVTQVHLVRGEDGQLEQVVLPVYGKGLWSTMYGFLALGPDMRTVRGLTFYEHGETPGLGGEIDNPAWKAQWEGKKAYNEEGEVDVQVVKGGVNPESPESKHQVDSLSGATITSRGVENLLRYWLGPDGFGPFLDKLRVEGGADGPAEGT